MGQSLLTLFVHTFTYVKKLLFGYGSSDSAELGRSNAQIGGYVVLRNDLF